MLGSFGFGLLFFLNPPVVNADSCCLANTPDYSSFQGVTATLKTTTYRNSSEAKTLKLGDYCLHEPGDSYNLTYSNECNYDGGYGGGNNTILIYNIDYTNNGFSSLHHP